MHLAREVIYSHLWAAKCLVSTRPPHPERTDTGRMNPESIAGISHRRIWSGMLAAETSPHAGILALRCDGASSARKASIFAHAGIPQRTPHSAARTERGLPLRDTKIKGCGNVIPDLDWHRHINAHLHLADEFEGQKWRHGRKKRRTLEYANITSTAAARSVYQCVGCTRKPRS